MVFCTLQQRHQRNLFFRVFLEKFRRNQQLKKHRFQKFQLPEHLDSLMSTWKYSDNKLKRTKKISMQHSWKKLFLKDQSLHWQSKEPWPASSWLCSQSLSLFLQLTKLIFQSLNLSLTCLRLFDHQIKIFISQLYKNSLTFKKINLIILFE